MLLLHAMERIYRDTEQCSKIFALRCTETVLDNSTTLVGYYHGVGTAVFSVTLFF